MSDYPLTWITTHLAVGHAPMSYDELDSIKAQGIDAIVNLCAEFTDLHEIEEASGFEVLFLPVEDETAPQMAEMEEGLAWLDESIYLGKKVLVHCRHGIGRTGTFITAYLLRRGFSLKQAGKMLKATRANPTNFPQWWLLRKFGKKEGRLTLQEPTPENRKNDNLEPFFTRYEKLLELVDTSITNASTCCGSDSCQSSGCNTCIGPVELELIEALYLHSKVNVTLSNNKRKELINLTALTSNENTLQEQQETNTEPEQPFSGPNCPLYQGTACLLHTFRPVSCRIKGRTLPAATTDVIINELEQLSRQIFIAVFSQDIDQPPPPVQLSDVVSGRFIQHYFQFLAERKKASNQ